MTYSSQKITAITITTFLAVIMGAFSILMPWSPFPLLFLLSIYVGQRTLKRIKRWETENFQWYVAKHPACSTAHGVSCFSCGHNKIQTRNLMNHSYTREHFCAQCGKTLYFSPEEN